jgi:hypothetical protein
MEIIISVFFQDAFFVRFPTLEENQQACIKQLISKAKRNCNDTQKKLEKLALGSARENVARRGEEDNMDNNPLDATLLLFDEFEGFI